MLHLHALSVVQVEEGSPGLLQVRARKGEAVHVVLVDQRDVVSARRSQHSPEGRIAIRALKKSDLVPSLLQPCVGENAVRAFSQ
eukprot:1685529-Rhodomonas_salina.1